MATYKVIQDIEAEDKLVGPLSLRQFVYACVAAFCLYLSFLFLTKHAAFLLILTLPIAGFTGFFAFPFRRDQPTEVWALAKIRFLFKPRKRIWDQSGVKELVTVTAPKVVQRQYTDGLSQTEVRSRLGALADTIDSRGWAIKNVNVSMYTQPQLQPIASDRLVDASSLPQEVSNVDVTASDDIMDEHANPLAHQFDAMMQASAQTHRQEIVNQLAQPVAAPATSTAPNDYWFLNQPAAGPAGSSTFDNSAVVAAGTDTITQVVPVAATPTPDEQAMVEKFKAENHSMKAAYGHMKVITPLSEQTAAQKAAPQPPKPVTPKVTPKETAAIINLANNDDLNVAAIAREATRQKDTDDDGEVTISLH